VKIEKTYSPRAADVHRSWVVVDATERPLGRLASHVAQLLRGKQNVLYAPHADLGDHVVVVNAAHVGITGKNKARQKTYYRHSGYLGNLHKVSLAKLLETRPERVVEHAVRGMLPKTSLGRAMFRRLRVYAGPTHPHGGQVGDGGRSETDG
jgi:large subunit ribosomal protein L13